MDIKAKLTAFKRHFDDLLENVYMSSVSEKAYTSMTLDSEVFFFYLSKTPIFSKNGVAQCTQWFCTQFVN